METVKSYGNYYIDSFQDWLTTKFSADVNE